jgi:hypothetical protein
MILEIPHSALDGGNMLLKVKDVLWKEMTFCLHLAQPFGALFVQPFDQRLVLRTDSWVAHATKLSWLIFVREAWWKPVL